LHPEVPADMNDVWQELVQNVEELQRNAAGQGSAAEGGTVLALADRTRGPLRRSDKAQGNPASQRLGSRGDVRHHYWIQQLIREIGSRPPHAALDLIEHQEGVVTIREIPGRTDIFIGQRVDP